MTLSPALTIDERRTAHISIDEALNCLVFFFITPSNLLVKLEFDALEVFR